MIHGLAVCAGVGGLELGIGLALGDSYRTVCYVEREAFAAANLVARMDEGLVDPAPIWDDLDTFDGRRWRGRVDLVSAGFPCQPFSVAGKQLGTDDDRWLWPVIERIIDEVRPRLVFVENVPPLVVHGLRDVLRTFTERGFIAEWGRVSAADIGASHGRERFFLLAVADTERAEWWSDDEPRGRRSERRNGAGQAASVARSEDVELGDTSHQRSPRRQRAAAAGRIASAERADREVADASSRGLGELRKPSGGPGLVDWTDAQLADANGAGLELQLRTAHHDDRCDAPGDESDGCDPAALADTIGDTVRVESERHQRQGWSERAAEREHTEPRADVPLFPPGPGARDEWAAILERWPELAPAIDVRSGTLAVGAVADTMRRHEPQEQSSDATEREQRSTQRRRAEQSAGVGTASGSSDRWQATTQSDVRRMAHGLANRVDRLRACGNGVVPLAAAYAFVALAARIGWKVTP